MGSATLVLSCNIVSITCKKINFWAIPLFLQMSLSKNYSVIFSIDNYRPKLNNRVTQTNSRGLCLFILSFPGSSDTFFSLSGAKLYKIRNFLMNFHSRWERKGNVLWMEGCPHGPLCVVNPLEWNVTTWYHQWLFAGCTLCCRNWRKTFEGLRKFWKTACQTGRLPEVFPDTLWVCQPWSHF